jgi:hypothetical protein
MSVKRGIHVSLISPDLAAQRRIFQHAVTPYLFQNGNGFYLDQKIQASEGGDTAGEAAGD